uniref:Tetraspanin n=1 Tax=Terrapene triunguis TaxID=2587831 RepID=A0A674K7W1_9SAUR
MGCFSFLKMMMFVFNGVIFLSGLAVLGIGIWVKVDGGSFVQILGAAAPQLMQLINVGYLCIAVGTFLLLMGFLGCCGAMKESKCLLLTVSALFTTRAFDSNRRVKHTSPLVKSPFEQRRTEEILPWPLNCCGVHNYTDFSGSAFQIRTNLTYPKSCCKDPTSAACNGRNVSSGCFRQLVSLIKEKSLLLGGAATGAAVLEVSLTQVSLVLKGRVHF